MFSLLPPNSIHTLLYLVLFCFFCTLLVANSVIVITSRSVRMNYTVYVVGDNASLSIVGYLRLRYELQKVNTKMQTVRKHDSIEGQKVYLEFKTKMWTMHNYTCNKMFSPLLHSSIQDTSFLGPRVNETVYVVKDDSSLYIVGHLKIWER